MDKSITETLRKINIELKGSAFLSISITIILLIIFFCFKTIYLAKNNKSDFIYETSKLNLINENNNIKKHFIYASKKGKKYYFYNCKANIKEENKIFFDNEINAQKSGYTLSKTCK